MPRKSPTTMEVGIDRMDNNIGYVLSNCVTCCGQCNIFKLNLSITDFLIHINKIHEYMSRKC